jgi:hypothetical protein
MSVRLQPGIAFTLIPEWRSPSVEYALSQDVDGFGDIIINEEQRPGPFSEEVDFLDVDEKGNSNWKREDDQEITNRELPGFILDLVFKYSHGKLTL